MSRWRWAEGEPPKIFVLSGTPRSGTTWVAEVMVAGLGASVVWEPLYGTATRAVRGLGPFGWRPYVPAEGWWEELERYLGGVLTGRLGTV